MPPIGELTRRDQILEAALSAFTDRGYADATIADVRERSGASVGSIYHHFGDKRGIAATLHATILADYQGHIAELLAKGPPAERGILGIVSRHLAWVAAHPDRASFLFAGRDPELAEATGAEAKEMNAGFFAAVREWLRPHAAAGAVRRMPLQLFYVIVLGPSQEFARQWLRDPDPKRIAAARPILARAAWDAVRADRKDQR